jgi:SH3 domain-containing YSC84-like protein 1
MKKLLGILLIACLGNAAFAASDRDDAIKRLDQSRDVIHQMMGANDKGIPEEVLQGAKCIAVVPHLLKAGFVFGAKHGRGVATCHNAKTGAWSAPAFISITGGSWGLQIGAEAIDLVMVVMNEKGMEHLLSNKFQIGGEASAAAGPVGRHAAAGTDWKLDTEILTYSRAKGAFAGLSLDGSVIKPDDDANKAIYAKDLPFRSILEGKVATPAVAKNFVASLGNAVREAKK